MRSVRPMTDEQFHSIVEDPRLSLGHIQPTEFECLYEYFRSSSQPNALDVNFHVPTSVSGAPSEYPYESRPRRPMHDPEADVIHASGSRPRRSTQSRRFMGEDEAEHSGSTSRQSRDTGRRARRASTSRSRDDDRGPYATPDEVRQIVREEGKIIEGRMMAKLKHYYDNLVALFSCRSSSSIPASVSQPRRMSPPITSSARASGVVSTAAGSSMHDHTPDHVQDVGGRRDTSLPLYTVAPSEPSTSLDTFERFAEHALTSVFSPVFSFADLVLFILFCLFNGA